MNARADDIDTHADGERQVADPTRLPAAPASVPGRVDAVIIGGGIVGVSTALALRDRGMSVAVCEKGHVAGEQSSRNWGWVRKQGRAPEELPIMLESQSIWRGLAARCGEDLGYREGGCYYLADSDEDAGYYRDWMQTARNFALDTEYLEGTALRGRLGTDASRWQCALFTPSDARAEPGRAAQAIARLAAREGVHVLEQCAVRGLLREGGAARGVITEHGEIRSDSVIVAGGAWSSLFLGAEGIRLPQLRVKGTVARLAPSPELFEGTVFCPEIALRRRADGGYTIALGTFLEHALTPSTLRFAWQFLPALRQEAGAVHLRLNGDSLAALRTPSQWSLDRPGPFEATRVLHPQPTPARLADLRRNLRAVFPALGDVPFAETWGGMIDTTPDVLPVLSDVDAVPGLFVGTGFSGHGFGIGPGAGKALADLVVGEANDAVMQPFRLGRFSDGTRIRPGPTL